MPIDRRFEILRKHFKKIKEYELEQYFLYIAQRFINTVENTDLLRCMHMMEGCELLGIAPSLAYITVSRLIINVQDNDAIYFGDAISIILQYLKDWSNENSDKNRFNTESGARRDFYSKHVINNFILEVLQAFGVNDAFDFLYDNNWYTPSQIGIKDKFIMKGMEQETSIVFGVFYRLMRDKDIRDEYLKLVNKLVNDKNSYKQQLAFFLIYHSVPARQDKCSIVNNRFHPLLERLIINPKLGWIKNAFSKFFRVNEIGPFAKSVGIVYSYTPNGQRVGSSSHK
jgi:hypothetical protein